MAVIDFSDKAAFTVPPDTGQQVVGALDIGAPEQEEVNSNQGTVIDFDTFNQEQESTGRSISEPAVQEDSASFDWGDYLKGSILEIPAATIAGAAGFVPATGFKHAAVAGQKAQQALGIVPEMTPQEQAQMGEDVFEYVQSFAGLLTPKTKTGKAGLETVGKLFKPIQDFSHWMARGIDPEKYPNMHNLIASGVELGTFGLIPKVAGAAKVVVKKRSIAKGKAKAKIAESDLAANEELSTMFDSVEEAIAKGEVNIKSLEEHALAKNKHQIERAEIQSGTLSKAKKRKAVKKLDAEFKVIEDKVKADIAEVTKTEPVKLTSEQIQAKLEGAENISTGFNIPKRPLDPYQQALLESKDVEVPTVSRLTPVQKQQLIQGAEPFSRSLDVMTKEGVPVDPEFKPLIDPNRAESRRIQNMKENAEWVQRQRGIQAEAGKGFAKDFPRATPKEPIVSDAPDLGTHTVQQMPGVVAKKTYKIDAEGKVRYVPEESTTLPSREFKAELGDRTKLIKHMEEKKIWRSFFEPLRNEKGNIPIEIAELSPKNREMLRKFGKLAEDAGMKMEEFLKTKGLSDKDIRRISSLHEKAREENPFASRGSEISKSKIKSDILTPVEGEVKVNISKESKGRVPVGEKLLSAIKKIDSTVTPGIIKAFTPGLQGFNKFKSPEIKEFYHWWKDNNLKVIADKKIITKQMDTLVGKYKKRKLREEAGIEAMYRSESGAKAMQQMGIKRPKEPSKYTRLIDELEVQYESLFNRINEMRTSIGKRPLSPMKDANGNNVYMPFFAHESFLDSLGKVFKGKQEQRGKANLVMDSAQDVSYRHQTNVKDATTLAHVKRRGLDFGTKLELDPIKTYAKYANTSIDHIHMSPINALIKEITSKKLSDPKTGKAYEMQFDNPELREFLGRWSNSIAGQPNSNMPRWLESAATTMSKNLTAATLYYSARTIMVQPTALLPTAVEFGIGPTIKGLSETILSTKDLKYKKGSGLKRTKTSVPIEKSGELSSRVADTFLNDIANEIAGTPLQKGRQKIARGGIAGMKAFDYVAAEATFRTAYNSVKNKMNEREAIRFADEAVVRTQGSGARGDLSPIQMNALGKAATLWQTYTINHANFIARDVLGIKNPNKNPMETARKVVTYAAGSAMISTLFEDVLGIQSPQPAPIKTIIKGLEDGDHTAVIALNTMLELGEAVPLLGSLKYGSHPGGPVLEYFGQAAKLLSNNDVYNQDLLPKALEGDKRSMVKIAEMLGKGLGVPGTGQALKYVRGKDRGEGTLGAILGRYKPDSSGSTRKKRRRKNRRSRRSRR